MLMGMPAASVRSERFAPFWLGLWDLGRWQRHPGALWSWRRRAPDSPSLCRAQRRRPQAQIGASVSPPFGSVCGIWAGGSATQGRFGHGAVECQIVPVYAVLSVVGRKLRSERAFRPLLARSVGFGPVAAPPRGALVMAPSSAR